MVSKIVLQTPPTKQVNLTWGESDSTFQLVDTEIPELNDGELLIKLLYFSNDPTQRGWISANQDPARAYVPPVLKGDTVRSLGLAEVLESKSSKFAKGDRVTGLFGWAEQMVVSEAAVSTKIDQSLAPELFLSSIGMTGLTAYFGLKNVAQFKEGETILVSAASGATGSMVVQIAKHLFKASRVIGIAGSEEKVEWVKSLGADYCANYRDPDYKKKLHEYIGGDFVDVYFDNVGGDMLDFALSHTKRFGRIVACGAISGYNDPSKMAVNRWFEIITNRLTVKGFIVFDFLTEFPQGVAAIAEGIKKGLIQATEGVSLMDLSSESKPLEKVPETWFKLFTDAKPKGKMVTKL